MTKVKVSRTTKSGFNIPASWDQTKQERQMNKKTAISINDRNVIAAGIIKQLKEQYPDYNAADVCKLLANAYTMALKQKKELANG